MTISRTGTNERGFTLIEMLIVLALISVIFAVSAPAFKNAKSGVDSRAAVRSFTAIINYAHRRSVMDGKPVRVAVNLENKTAWLEAANERGDFVKIQASEARARRMPGDVTIEPEPDADSNMYYITFFPDGTADPRKFRIHDNNENTSLFVEVHSATGNVAVKSI